MSRLRYKDSPKTPPDDNRCLEAHGKQRGPGIFPGIEEPQQRHSLQAFRGLPVDSMTQAG